MRPSSPSLARGLFVLLTTTSACAREAVAPAGAEPPPSSTAGPTAPEASEASALSAGGEQSGLASFYSRRLTGRRTASGERYDPSGLTAAHRTLPFGTWVEVRRADDGRKVLVRINDRGPFTPGRIIDLSHRAASELGLFKSGVARVIVRRVAESASR